MRKYLSKMRDLTQAFYSFNIQHAQANALAKLTTCALLDLRVQVLFEVIEEPSIKELASILQLDEDPYWIDLLANYVRYETFPIDRREAQKI